LVGADVAALVDAHFADPAATPADLASGLRELHVPLGHNTHIAAAALRADPNGVRETGRWLLHNGVEREVVSLGLLLLHDHDTDDDIPLIRPAGVVRLRSGRRALPADGRVGGAELAR
jgi:hypothetical protein